MKMQLSIVIPVYNRTTLLRYPLQSLRAAAAASPHVSWELIVIDDGSQEDVSAALTAFSDLPLRLHRLQKNCGLLAARLQGLALATGDAVCFLDGDDLVATGKFSDQLNALQNADVTYGDVGRVTLDRPDAAALQVRHDAALGPCNDPAEFFLGVQPGPHNPIFRRSYLVNALEHALFPPDRLYDSIAETWMYYQLSIRPARIVYVPGVWTVVGEHPGERLSRAWERQAWAALRLMQAFMRCCPITAENETARRRISLCAFATWRALPHGFRGFPTDAFISLWRSGPPLPHTAMGGSVFQFLAKWFGPVPAGRCLKYLQRPSYRRVRSLNRDQLAALTHE